MLVLLCQGSSSNSSSSHSSTSSQGWVVHHGSRPYHLGWRLNCSIPVYCSSLVYSSIPVYRSSSVYCSSRGHRQAPQGPQGQEMLQLHRHGTGLHSCRLVMPLFLRVETGCNAGQQEGRSEQPGVWQ
jgi:hypothetical protein